VIPVTTVLFSTMSESGHVSYVSMAVRIANSSHHRCGRRLARGVRHGKYRARSLPPATMALRVRNVLDVTMSVSPVQSWSSSSQESDSVETTNKIV
jgi:hypothetical protein